MPSYDDALATLYQAPHQAFVAERSRLSAELKASGDKPAAARLAKAPRPTLSAWVVNQLWWQARDAFEPLFETAAQLRAGKLEARAAHRAAQATLTARAQRVLSEAGHSNNEALLRRVSMTLSALAASGGFDPDVAGALSKDRDPPGFEAFGAASFADPPPKSPPPRPRAEEPRAANSTRPTKPHEDRDLKRRQRADAERAREQAAREREEAAHLRKEAARVEAEQRARRRELEARWRDAKAELLKREHERAHLEKELAAADRALEGARVTIEQLKAELSAE